MANNCHRLTNLGLVSKTRELFLSASLLMLLVLSWPLSGCEKSTRTAPVTGERSFEVVEMPFEVTLNFAGSIRPGDVIEIAAPFEGTIERIHFTYGDQVEAGQVLIELNPAGIERARAEAETTWLRADAAARRIEAWEKEPEMSRAVRALSTAKADLQDVERKLEESRALFDRGLIARSEYEGALQQQRASRLRVEQTSEELIATRRRGEGAERRIALLEYEIARARLDVLNLAVGQATIHAPIAGVIVRPPTTEAGGTENLNVGARVVEGQSLGVIARTEGLDVVFGLEESDVNTIRVGQPVSVTGPGFSDITLRGSVSSVAGQAEPDGRGTRVLFSASARLDALSEDAARNVRMGMTANVAVVTYRNPSAIIVPPEAVQGVPPDMSVMVRPDEGAELHRKQVAIGQVGPNGVEILSGLSVGEIVVWMPAN